MPLWRLQYDHAKAGVYTHTDVLGEASTYEACLALRTMSRGRRAAAAWVGLVAYVCTSHSAGAAIGHVEFITFEEAEARSFLEHNARAAERVGLTLAWNATIAVRCTSVPGRHHPLVLVQFDDRAKLLVPRRAHPHEMVGVDGAPLAKDATWASDLYGFGAVSQNVHEALAADADVAAVWSRPDVLPLYRRVCSVGVAYVQYVRRVRMVRNVTPLAQVGHPHNDTPHMLGASCRLLTKSRAECETTAVKREQHSDKNTKRASPDGEMSAQQQQQRVV